MTAVEADSWIPYEIVAVSNASWILRLLLQWVEV